MKRELGQRQDAQQARVRRSGRVQAGQRCLRGAGIEVIMERHTYVVLEQARLQRPREHVGRKYRSFWLFLTLAMKGSKA